ncbi:MAG: NAD-dependent epimerase/dehydratase family protein [Endomicrobiia bacterium]
MKTILLTGATGFLGSHLLKRLLEENYNIIVLKRSFSNTYRIANYLTHIKTYNIDIVNLEEVFKENKIDTVIHCATNYGRNNESPLNILQSNLILPLTILQFSIKYNIKTFINTDTIIDKNINNYSLSKNQFLEWFKKSSNSIQTINISLEHFYGANDNKTKFTTFIIGSMIKKIHSIDLTLGEQKRYFIYIDDVVNAFITILTNKESLGHNFINYEVATDKSISIKDFVLMVKKITKNTTTLINFGKIPYRKNELMDCKIDITKLKNIGWNQQFSLEEGLEETINAERNNL